MNGSASALSLQAEIDAAMDAVRSTPEAIAPRMALFQLSAICGNWRRSMTQLETMEKLDDECAVLVRTYGRLIAAESIRTRVFAGEETPVAFGKPPAWLAMMAEALVLDRKGDTASAQALRETARQDAAARSGTLGTAPFQWIMDADPRVGAALEVVVDGQYRWLPLDHLAELRAAPPKAMRDLAWQPVTLRLRTGTELAAFVPSRYPGSESDPDDAVRLCKETRWIDKNGEQWGLGQRLFASDVGDHPFLDIRRLRFDDAGPDDDG
jgi:type VI secretion system protein ImpE